MKRKITLFIVAMTALSATAQSHKVYAVEQENGAELLGYKDQNGHVIIEAKYVFATNFNDGVATVRTSYEENGNIINETGKIVANLADDYDEINLFNKGFTTVVKENKYGLINTKGKEIISPKYNWIETFGESFYLVREGNLYFGIYTNKGKQIVPPKFTMIWDGGNQTFIVEGKDTYGLYSAKGKEIVAPIYEHIQAFSEGLAAAVKDNKVGYINLKGKVVIPFTYDYKEVSPFKNGKATVFQGDKKMTINKKGICVDACH